MSIYYKFYDIDNNEIELNFINKYICRQYKIDYNKYNFSHIFDIIISSAIYIFRDGKFSQTRFDECFHMTSDIRSIAYDVVNGTFRFHLLK